MRGPSGPPPADRLKGSVLRAVNRRIGAADPHQHNPRPVEGLAWDRRMREAHLEIRGEWEHFRSSGGRLPRIECVLDESQGNDGSWSVGLLVAAGRPVEPLARWFPRTVAAAMTVPGLRSVLLSVLAPGARLPEHAGPNAGVLRYHLGVSCGEGAALRVGDQIVPYLDGESVLFDDTAPHSAWNDGPTERVTLFCDLLRPVPGALGVGNAAWQRILSSDRRYRAAPARAAAWHEALNPRLTAQQ